MLTHALIIAALLAALVPAAFAQTTDGLVRDDNFRSDLNIVCAAGRTLGAGCDAIRTREIVDAAAAPWRAIGRVNAAGFVNRSHCTGTLVADNIVLTASHCLYNDRDDVWVPADTVKFVAGYQRGESAAVSSVTRYVLHADHDVGSGQFLVGPAQDWALLVLADPIGRDVGFLALDQRGPDLVVRGDIILAGYPGLRPHVLSVARNCGPASAQAGILQNRCSAMGGDSGAPLLAIGVDGSMSVMGVLSAVAVRPEGLVSLSIPVAAIADALEGFAAK